MDCESLNVVLPFGRRLGRYADAEACLQFNTEYLPHNYVLSSMLLTDSVLEAKWLAEILLH